MSSAVWTHTPGVAAKFASPTGVTSADMVASVSGGAPTGRFTTPQEAADLTVFLASSRSGNTTGADVASTAAMSPPSERLGRGHVRSASINAPDIARGETEMTTMTALRAHRRGGPEVLQVEQAPVPVPGDGEVLVAVHAAGITFDELTWPETWTRDGVDRTPIIPSHEVSGVVVDVAPGVTEFAVGDEVFGLIRFDRDGAAADYVAVPATDLAVRPAAVSHVASAALPLAGLTAWQALVDHAGVAPGERVLVQGGAGGVGALAVELAGILGADVTTTVRSDAARNLVLDLGAQHVIDTRTDELDTGYDVVIDTIGGQTLLYSFDVLRPGGRLITLSAPPPEGLAETHGVAATFFIVVPDHAQLTRLAELVDADRLHVAIADTFALDAGQMAFQSGRGPHRRPGKTVLVVRGK